MAIDGVAPGGLLVVTDEEMSPERARMLGAVMPQSDAVAAAQRIFGAFASKAMAEHHRMHCEAGELIAKRWGAGLPSSTASPHTYERWDGMGAVANS